MQERLFYVAGRVVIVTGGGQRITVDGGKVMY